MKIIQSFGQIFRFFLSSVVPTVLISMESIIIKSNIKTKKALWCFIFIFLNIRLGRYYFFFYKKQPKIKKSILYTSSLLGTKLKGV